jgi:hypothetical protein
MSNIKIHNISPSGSELFRDSESYLSELKDNEVDGIEGGIATITVPTSGFSFRYTFNSRTVSFFTRR